MRVNMIIIFLFKWFYQFISSIVSCYQNLLAQNFRHNRLNHNLIIKGYMFVSLHLSQNSKHWTLCKSYPLTGFVKQTSFFSLDCDIHARLVCMLANKPIIPLSESCKIFVVFLNMLPMGGRFQWNQIMNFIVSLLVLC